MIMPCQFVINHNAKDSVTVYCFNGFVFNKESWKFSNYVLSCCYDQDFRVFRL